mmetsp:Transcript_6720/g.10503  ORF Transcript_6720/g.10503 Transcript_6720/m.10503 type:complete len:271 (-) Transcript_6720:1274-2086(-)
MTKNNLENNLSFRHIDHVFVLIELSQEEYSNTDIVRGPPRKSLAPNALGSKAAFLCGISNASYCILISKGIPYTIRCNDNVLVTFRYVQFIFRNFWLSTHTKRLHCCITKCTGDLDMTLNTMFSITRYDDVPPLFFNAGLFVWASSVVVICKTHSSILSILAPTQHRTTITSVCKHEMDLFRVCLLFRLPANGCHRRASRLVCRRSVSKSKVNSYKSRRNKAMTFFLRGKWRRSKSIANLSTKVFVGKVSTSCTPMTIKNSTNSHNTIRL